MANSNSALATLDDTFETYLVKKAPSVPEKWRGVLVKYLPWITLVLLILALPAVLIALGLSAVVAPMAFMAGVSNGVGFSLAIVVLIISLILEAMAIPGLFKRSRSAWNLLYYSALINGVYNLISFNLGGLIIGTLLTLYLLFQIRSHYK